MKCYADLIPLLQKKAPENRLGRSINYRGEVRSIAKRFLIRLETEIRAILNGSPRGSPGNNGAIKIHEILDISLGKRRTVMSGHDAADSVIIPVIELLHICHMSLYVVGAHSHHLPALNFVARKQEAGFFV